MSAEAIGFYISSRYGSGCFSLYYDFENYSSNYILSTGDGDYSPNQMHSGEIFGDLAAFKDTKVGSGAFNLSPGDNNYIKIENILLDEDLATPMGWTFLISQEKIDNSCGTIFSNFAGEQYVTSGWEFGINNANQLYFKYQDAQGGVMAGEPYYNILTLNNTPSAKNYYSVTYGSNRVELGSYDPQKDSWETVGTTVNSNYIRNNKDWYIGRGEYDYIGYMDKFAFFNIPLTSSDVAGIINASYQEIEFNKGQESLLVSGVVTGYGSIPAGETGTLYSSGEFSGYTEYTINGDKLVSYPIKGFVPSGSGYFEEGAYYTGSGDLTCPETGQFYNRALATEDLPNAVTGFDIQPSGCEKTFRTEVYRDTDVTGVLWTGSGVGEELYSPSKTIITDEGDTVLTGPGATGDYSYNPDTLSYKGERGGDYVEYILNSNTDINFIADYGFSDVVGRNSFFIDGEFRDRGGGDKCIPKWSIPKHWGKSFRSPGFYKYLKPHGSHHLNRRWKLCFK